MGENNEVFGRFRGHFVGKMGGFEGEFEGIELIFRGIGKEGVKMGAVWFFGRIWG